MFFSKTVRVVIKNQNLAIEAKTGSNLYQVLVNEKVIPQTLCRGNGQCGKCKVHVSQRNPSKPNKKEQLVLARINLDAGFRLACQTTIKDDMVVDTSEITASSMPNDMQVRPVTKIETAEDQQPKQETDTQPIETTTAEQSTPKPTAKPLPRERKPKEEPKQHALVDGLLLSQYRGQLRYFLYSAAIDGISQEGVIENATNLAPYIENGMLSDYVHDVLKIKDIDRIVILSDEPSTEGEILFDIASYKPFDIGAMPCELLRPTPEVSDLTLFIRLLSVKAKKRLMISLDNLRHTFYFADDGIVKIPNSHIAAPANLFDVVPTGNNPVTDINDDLKTVKTVKQFIAPDSLPLHILIKTASLMIKKKLADSELRIVARNRLEKSVPLEYVVKIVQNGDQSAFSIYRDKEASLVITQDMMNSLIMTKKFIHYAIEYTEANLGNIEEIIITTPAPMPGLLDGMFELSMIPKRHENITVHNSGDSSVKAVRLFQEQDVRTYIQNNLGNFSKGE